MTMSRGGSRRGGERSNETAQPGADGWAVAGNGPSRPPPKAGDLSNFGKIAKSTPTSFTPVGVFTGKKDSAKKEPSSLSRTNSSSNMFSMLSQNADVTVVEAGASKHAYSRKGSVDITQNLSEPQQRKKLVLQPRSKPVEEPTAAAPPPSSDGSSDEEPPELPPPPSLSEAEVVKKIVEDIKEFFGVRNLAEAEEYFSNLPIEHRFRLVDKLVATAIESKETDAQLVADFFAQAIGKELCGPTIFEDGFMPTAEILDDLKYDVPKAFELMAIMMKGAGLDKDEERSNRIASKSTDSHKLLALLSS
jgi:translation initiation factor 4G